MYVVIYNRRMATSNILLILEYVLVRGSGQSQWLNGAKEGIVTKLFNYLQ